MLAFLRAFIVGVKIGRPDLSEDSHKLIACAASVSARVRQESWETCLIQNPYYL